jgi:hypothetical protein
MTGEEYFALLPEPYRSRAIEAFRSEANKSALTYGEYSLSDALDNGFVWEQTVEGFRFWYVLYTRLDDGDAIPPPVSFPLPLPWPAKKNT